jgi:ectoine hydroxylase
MKIINQIGEFLKSYKFSHVLFNLWNYKSLKHNAPFYRKHKIKKPLFWPISSKDFDNNTSDGPWLDDAHANEKLKDHPRLADFSNDIRNKIIQWPDKGYMILENFLSEKTVNDINQNIDELVKTKELDFKYGNKLMFAFKKSAIIDKVINQRSTIQILDFILGKEVIPFQTINFIRGSEQRAHSDSLHMTTYPLGYLIAVWIALEDVNEENGPLFYYPGSHKLPYLLNEDYDHGGNFFRIGDKAYKKYEDKIESVIQKEKLEKIPFYAKKGDAFIWHANLLHGGSPILKQDSTRKSMVIHYYAKDVIKYHELAQRPSVM